MDEVTVYLKNNSYPIYIGPGILHSLGGILRKKNLGKKCTIVTNSTVNKLYGNQVKKNLNSEGFETVILEVPDNETSKSLKYAEKLYVELLNNHRDRNSSIVALGGGVIGDLAGFVAGTYLRGISLIQVPTTLLAQVDSAIGGKAAVDLLQGKNMVGVFHQPLLVVSDIETLKTLPKNDFNSGLAEIIKYGLISNNGLFEVLERNIEKIKQQNVKILVEIITKCSKIKSKIVEEDEKERGNRAILNLGHTLGHALETITNYSRYSHGEAISIGIVYAAKLSIEVGMLNINEYRRVIRLIQSAGSPTKITNNLIVDELLEIMQRDKKVKGGKIRMVLPKKIGEVIITDKIPMKTLKIELEKMLE